MEDFLKFLAIAGVIAFGIFRQFNKDKEKNAEERPVSDPPYQTYETEMPPMVEMPRQRAPKSKSKQSSLPPEGVRTTTQNSRLHNSSDIATASPIEEEEVASSEFSIQSAEEARRAIIWSEILQRKY